MRRGRGLLLSNGAEGVVCSQEGSPCEEAAAGSIRSAHRYREGGGHADGERHQGKALLAAAGRPGNHGEVTRLWLCAAAGTAASEGSASGVQRDEVSGVPESEHPGGDDTGVSLHTTLHLLVTITRVIRLLVCSLE